MNFLHSQAAGTQKLRVPSLMPGGPGANYPLVSLHPAPLEMLGKEILKADFYDCEMKLGINMVWCSGEVIALSTCGTMWIPRMNKK